MGKEKQKNYKYDRQVRERQAVHVVPDKNVQPENNKRRLPAKDKKKKKDKKKV
jgi:hypothetical protein